MSLILFTGATAVFTDNDPETLSLDSKSVESRICNRTKAIVPVHIFGNPVDIDLFCFLAEKHKLSVIADVAHTF